MAAPTATPLGISRSSRYFPELESLRGIAILLVFAFHVDGFVRSSRVFETAVSPWKAFVAAGHTGVDLFFVLSAFLLSLPFLVDAAGGRRAHVGMYFARRALRILPLYWAAVVVSTVLTAERPADLVRGLPFLFFLNSFAGTSALPVPYGMVWWSLATEVQFYLLLPILLLLRSRPGQVAGLVLLGAYAAAYAAVVSGRLHMQTVPGHVALMFSVFARGPLFLWGILAAAIYRRHGTRFSAWLAGSPWLRNGGADLALLACFVALGFLLQWVVSIGLLRQMGSADQLWHVVNGGLWTLILLLLLLAPLRLKPLLSNAVLGELGILSYSIYIIHGPFIPLSLQAIGRIVPTVGGAWNWPTITAVTLLTIACMGLSAVSYRLIERPFLAQKARFDI